MQSLLIEPENDGDQYYPAVFLVVFFYNENPFFVWFVPSIRSFRNFSLLLLAVQLARTLKYGGFFFIVGLSQKSKSSFLLANRCGDRKCFLPFLELRKILFLIRNTNQF